MDPSRKAATQKSTLRYFSDLCDLEWTYLKNPQMRQKLSQQKLSNQLETFAHDIHSSLHLKDTSFKVANDGKRLVGCDPAERDPQGRRPDDGRGREWAGSRRAAGQPDPRADAALQDRPEVE